MSSSAEAAPGVDHTTFPGEDGLPALRQALDGLDDRIPRPAHAARRHRGGGWRSRRRAARCGRGGKPPSSAACSGSMKAPCPAMPSCASGGRSSPPPSPSSRACSSPSATPGMDGRFAAAAREHLGALTPLRVYRSAAQAIGEVLEGRAGAAILPLPGDGNGRGRHRPGMVARPPAATPQGPHPCGGPPALLAKSPGRCACRPGARHRQLPRRPLRRRHLPHRLGDGGADQPGQPRPDADHRRLQAAVHPPQPPDRRACGPAAGGGRGLRGARRPAPRRASAGCRRRRSSSAPMPSQINEENATPMSGARRPQPRPEIMAIAPYVGGEFHLPGVVPRASSYRQTRAPSGRRRPRGPPSPKAPTA